MGIHRKGRRLMQLLLLLLHHMVHQHKDNLMVQ